MFYNSKLFNIDLSSWAIGKVTTLEEMFTGATSYKQTLCGKTWVESKAKQISNFKNSQPVVWSTKSRAGEINNHWVLSGPTKNIASLPTGSSLGGGCGGISACGQCLHSTEITAVKSSTRIKVLGSNPSKWKHNPILLGICYGVDKSCRLYCGGSGSGKCDTYPSKSTRYAAHPAFGFPKVGMILDINLDKNSGYLEFCIDGICLGHASCGGMTASQLTDVTICVDDGTGAPNTVSLEIVETTESTSKLANAEIATSPCTCPSTLVTNSNKAGANSIAGIQGDSVTVTCNTGWSGTKATVCGSNSQWNPIVECAVNSCTSTQVANSDKSEANSITGTYIFYVSRFLDFHFSPLLCMY
jgi:hypothetical protein